MRTVLFLVQKEFLQIRRNRMMLPLILIMPVFQMLLLSYAANYEVKNLALGMVDHDLSPASRQLTAKFGASGYFQVQPAVTAKAASYAMAGDQTDLILEIPPHFERNLVREGTAALFLTANAINATKAGLGMSYAGNIIRDFNATVNGGQSTVDGAPPSTVEVTYSNWYNPRLDYKTFMVPGILGVIASLIICFLTALNIVREREIGTIEQLNVTPLRKWQFILGKLLPFWLLSLVMMTIGLTVGKMVFDIPMLGNLWLVFGYTATFTPCMLGLGLLISNFANSQQQAMFTAWFFLIIFILMCGLFTPTDSMPQWAQWRNGAIPSTIL